MQQFDKTINGVNFSLICETYDNRYSWGHKVKLYKDYRLVSTAKIRYYNRTWEAYTYQSVIKLAISNYLNEIKENVKESFKTANGFKIMSAKRWCNLAVVLGSNKDFLTVDQLYKSF